MKNFFPSYLKIAALTSSKFFKLAKTVNSTRVYGPDGKFLNCLAEKLKFQFDILQPTDGEWGSFENGTWTGIIGMIKRGEAHMGITYMGLTEARFRAVDFSFPYASLERTFVVKQPGQMPHIAAYIYPFNEDVWILYCLLIITSTFLLQKFMLKSTSILFNFILILSSTLSQPIECARLSDRKRVIFGIWLTIATVMPFLYKINFLSYITMPGKMSGIKDFHDLSQAVLSKNYKCLAPKGAADTELLLKSKIDYLEVLGKAIKQNNWKYELNKDLDDLIDDSTAVIAARQFVQLTFGDLTFSNAEMSKDSFGVWNTAIALKRDFCCKRQLDDVIFNILSAGLYNKWFYDEDLFYLLSYFWLKFSPLVDYVEES
ncbi:Glutamate receptor ionotropic like protein [Argiope bruennichi]|uniref:Glutamate receptor ionotropic like protein n=1 Tax=Argiope bruennichi TaxID=94029 RepID=A0A8T0F8M5_ARGBR|nr:Glutamate receptor ionotropic like protein [Argiope bruennichi]